MGKAIHFAQDSAALNKKQRLDDRSLPKNLPFISKYSHKGMNLMNGKNGANQM